MVVRGVSVFGEVWCLVSPFSDTIVSMYRDPGGWMVISQHCFLPCSVCVLGAMWFTDPD